MKIGKLEINLDELQEFIVEAGKNGYAGNGEQTRMQDGSKSYAFHKGDFHYTDNYAGSYQAPGSEIVRWQREDGQRIWQMSYSGGMLPEFWNNEELSTKTFIFLKEALLQSNSKYPFRGPEKFDKENFRYWMSMEGDIKRFSGKEFIQLYDHVIFSQDFIGGLVILK